MEAERDRGRENPSRMPLEGVEGRITEGTRRENPRWMERVEEGEPQRGRGPSGIGRDNPSGIEGITPALDYTCTTVFTR